jgi:hypothetical protein
MEKKLTRDYNKNPIVIKDYGDLFREIFPVVLIWIFFFCKDVKIIFSGEIFEIVSNNFFFAIKPIIIMPLATTVMIVYFYFQIKKIFEGNAYFKFTNNKVYCNYYERLFLKPGIRLATKNVNVDLIEKISFCIMSDFPFRYGRNMKKKPKVSTFAIFFRTVYYTLLYFFSILPCRLYKLIKNKELLNLLNKNIVITFKNENYFLVNIYSKKDLDDLLLYFKSKNIDIDNKSKFIYHLQNIGTRWQFPNKYEQWCEKF